MFFISTQKYYFKMVLILYFGQNLLELINNLS